MIGSGGLSTVGDEDLVRLFRAVHRGELSCPIDPIGLAVTGLLRLSDELGLLRGLEAPAVKAVLIAVLAERTARTQGVRGRAPRG